MSSKPAKSSITAPRGFRAAGITCGLKPSGQPDLALVVSDRLCSAAGVFTQSRFPGAPVIVGRRHLRRGHAQAIVCNSGIANVATGEVGLRDALAMCDQVAASVGCDRHQVLPASTGLIGPCLPMDKVSRGIATLASKLSRGPTADAETAHGIMTTDLVPKSAHRSLRPTRTPQPSRAKAVRGSEAKPSTTLVHLGGIAKGSGMISPDLATMLCFITTDAAITPPTLRTALRTAVSRTFNRITVDSDTSTSDMVLILANGAAGHAEIGSAGHDHEKFVAALTDLCQDLAYQIVSDGEGATKVFQVRIQHAATHRDADRVGRAVADSPLVKTAVHGGDPNWGRLLMAVGKSGARIESNKLSLTIGDVVVFQRGTGCRLDAGANRKIRRLLGSKQIVFTVDLGLGQAAAQWLGCDLSRQYVTINAEYTT